MSADEKLDELLALAGEASAYGLSDSDAIRFHALEEEVRAALRAYDMEPSCQ